MITAKFCTLFVHALYGYVSKHYAHKRVKATNYDPTCIRNEVETAISKKIYGYFMVLFEQTAYKYHRTMKWSRMNRIEGPKN